jgi:hypothetical protein
MMSKIFSRLLDNISNFFAPRKGLLPALGLLLIVLNFIFRIWPMGWMTRTDFLLHLGLILSIFGIMLSWAL